MQLLSNFMANWVGEKKKRKTKITESRITTLTAHPTPARPNTPSPPFQLGGPLHPTPPAPQGHLRLFGFAGGFAILFPPSPSQNQCQPLQQPHPWAKPEPGAPGQVQPHHRTIFPIHAGTSPPPSPGSRDGVRSHRCCISRSILTRCPRPGKLITRLGGLRADSRRGSRTAQPGCGAAVPAAVIYLPLFLEPN